MTHSALNFARHTLLALPLLIGGCSNTGSFYIEPLTDATRVSTDSFGCYYDLERDCLKELAVWSEPGDRALQVTYFNHCPLRLVVKACVSQRDGGIHCQMIKLDRGTREALTVSDANGRYSAKFFGSEDPENDKLCELRVPGLVF
ncbi:hypothetical protein FCL40_01945 [Ferrimonas sediminicola]|uniref:Uncharacterized protein n=1 Tax=Ferrimonas sediminicola TaxID=2569538 RepID=A0A4U1BJ07_9GAMM|nr:hypothetical protein [Ferrimonas sediminicola]TKB51343.1 hypothetical protein FCL40_01945 [Ferrimonas sediminicola]